MNARARLAVMLILVCAGSPLFGADEKPAAKEAKPAAAKEAKPGAVKKSPADYRGPLPFYYSKVLSPDQKEKLYAIYEKHAVEIKALQGKLKELEEARNKELDAALTPEQLARIKELREESMKGKTPAKAVSKTEGAAKPAEKKSE